jgi:hypothetical protein
LWREEVEDTSDDGGHDSEEEEEEHEEEEGHYVGVMDLLQDPHPHVDTGLATLFVLG